MKIFQGVSGVSLQSTRYLTDALRELGHAADSYTFQENRLLQSMEDVCLHIDKKKWWLYPVFAFRVIRLLFGSMKKYDVFHFHYGHSFLPLNLDLPLLRHMGKVVVMEYHGSEIRYKMNRVVEGQIKMVVDNKRKAKSEKLQRRIASKVDGLIVHDEELHGNLLAGMSKVHIIPLRMDIRQFDYVLPSSDERITIVHAPSKRNLKGTEFVLSTVDHLKKKYDLEFILVENKSNEEARKIYQQADIVVDQLIIGSYGMFAIECMAYGKPVICYMGVGAERSGECGGVINANINNLEEILESLIRDRAFREKSGKRSRQYVEQKHDSRVCAEQILNLYKSLAEEKQRKRNA